MSNAILRPSIVVLAAGRSARLGRPKQLLAREGSTLLRRSLSTAVEAGIGKVYVTLPPAARRMREECAGLPVTVIENPLCEEGIASSIRLGLEKALQHDPETDGILFMVCDQPAVAPGTLQCLTGLQTKNDSPLSACSYGGTTGTPALFHRSLFDELTALTGDKGAGRVIARHVRKEDLLDFPEGLDDIDTETDYRLWISESDKTRQA